MYKANFDPVRTKWINQNSQNTKYYSETDVTMEGNWVNIDQVKNTVPVNFNNAFFFY